MKQIKAFGPQDLRVIDAAPPVPGDGEVLVEVQACGICGSDKWFWHVEGPSDYVAGHEAAGRVAAVGAGVKRLQPGDRVAVNNVKGCGRCPFCLKGEFVRCRGPVVHMGFGFSELIAVPEINCLNLHSSVGFEAGSLIFDNWGTPYAALMRTDMAAGDRVAVVGCGPIGLAAVALAKLRGASVLAVDPIPERLAAAVRMGAGVAMQPADADLGAAAQSFTNGEGIDIVVECSGKPASYELALRLLRIGGTIAAIGEGAQMPFKSSDLIHKQLTIAASLYSTMADGAAVQELMVRGEIDPLAFVTHTFPLERVPEMFGKVISGEEGLIKAIVARGGAT